MITNEVSPDMLAPGDQVYLPGAGWHEVGHIATVTDDRGRKEVRCWFGTSSHYTVLRDATYKMRRR